MTDKEAVKMAEREVDRINYLLETGMLNRGLYQIYARRYEWLFRVFLLARDGAKIVRCRDCDWYRDEGLCMNPHCGKSFYGCPVKPEHYCSKGERRVSNG